MMIIFFAALIITQQNFFASANKADEDFLLGRPGYQFEDPNVLEITVEAKCPRTDELHINLYDHLCFKSDIAFTISAYKESQFQISLPYEDGEDEARKVLDAWSAENPDCVIEIGKVQGIHEELLPEGCQERRENHVEVSFERRNLFIFNMGNGHGNDNGHDMGPDPYPAQFSHKDVIGFPARDQGNCGSCVGQSVASTLDYHFSKCAGQPVQTSAAWIYMFSGDRSWARGTYYNKLIKGVQSGGVAMEDEVPYEPACSGKQTFSNVDQSIKDFAKTRKVSNDVHYYNHMRDNAETRKRKIKQLIMERGPGMVVFRTGFKKNPWATACYDYGTGLTGHAVTCTGWNEEGVEYRDSRGDQYCNGGYGIFRWNDLNKLSEGLTFLKIDCPVDPCINNPCQNGASCINNAGKAKCDCKGGFVGDLCQLPPGSIQVECRMTMDNYVTSVAFNGQNLNVAGNLNDWQSVKTFTYSPTPGGTFEICGYEDSSNSCGCSCSGFILECDNGIVSNTQWQAAGQSSPINPSMIKSGSISFGGCCTTSSAFYLPGQKNGAAQKIWPSNGQKYACFTLTPEPAPITQPIVQPPTLPQATQPAVPANPVQCTMTMDNFVTSVKYNGQNLNCAGDLNNWQSKKTFTYTPVEGGAFEICGYEESSNNCGCTCSGLLLYCDNGVVSSTQWVAAGQNSPMDSSMIQRGAVSWGGVCETSSAFSLQGSNKAEAQKIWPSNGNKYACFSFTPRPAPPLPSNNLNLNYCVTWGDPHIISFFKKYDDLKENGDRIYFQIDQIKITTTQQQNHVYNNKATIISFEIVTDDASYTITRDDIKNNRIAGPNHYLLNKMQSYAQWPRARYPGVFTNMMTVDGIDGFALFWRLKAQNKNGGYIDLGVRYAGDVNKVIGQCGPNPEIQEFPVVPPTTGLLADCCSKYSHIPDLHTGCLIDFEQTCMAPGATRSCCDEMSPPDCTVDGCGAFERCDMATKMCVPKCDGSPNGNKIDACGVCGGDGTSCLDCRGVMNGNAKVDGCGVCEGDGSSCKDCNGVMNGNAKLDGCGVCGGDGSSCKDCKGVMNGDAKVDGCGVCGGDGSSCKDCKGVMNGGAKLDACGVCGGDGSSCKDCKGVMNGDAKLDACGVCGGDGFSCRDTSFCDTKSKDIPRCGRCLYNQQCEEGTFCDPIQKRCVQNESGSGDKCDSSGESAKCAPGCKETNAGFPYSCHCANSDFPQNWVPGCPSDPCDPNPCQSGESCSHDELGGPKCIADDTCTQTEAAFCKLTPCSIMCKPAHECPCSCPSDPPTKAPTHLVAPKCATPDPDYCALADCHHLCPASLHCPCKCGAEPDCAGTPGGSAQKDVCGKCNGDGSTCMDCAGVPNGDAEEDECGVCNGDGSTCTVCDADYSIVEENKQEFLDECSAEYPAVAVDCFEGSIVIKWEGDAEKIKETKQMIKQAGGVKTKSFGPFKLKPKKNVCAAELWQQAKKALSASANEECKTVLESKKLDGICSCVNSVDTSSIPWDDLDCLLKATRKRTIKERIEDCECPQRQCRMMCPNGFEKNARGCETCKCAEASESSSSTLMTMQQVLTYSDHPVTMAFALVGLIVVFYSMFKCVARKSGFDIRGNWSYSSVVPEEDEI